MTACFGGSGIGRSIESAKAGNVGVAIIFMFFCVWRGRFMLVLCMRETCSLAHL